MDVLALAHGLRVRGEPFALATLVRVVRPTSGRPGAMAIVTPGKELRGWVGGSCAAPVVIAESLAAMRDGRPRLVHLSRQVGRSRPPDGVVEYVMECHSGGAMDIYIEPHLPKLQLLIVGDSPVASALAPLGRLMDYRVVVVAPGIDPEAYPDADEVIVDLGRLPDLATADTYAVVATMGKHDETAIRALAPSRAAYVGLVASRKRASLLLDELAEAGVPRDALNRVRSPAGIDLSAEVPQEIALSIVAEITKLRRTTRMELPVGPAPSLEAPPSVAIDPVCGMEVDPVTALSAVHVGTTYYFCSDGCRSRFHEDPHAFLS